MEAGDALVDGGSPDASAQNDSGGATCNAGNTLLGSFAIANSADVATLANYACITGDLTIDAAGLANVVLPTLVQIGGTFYLDNNPGLTSVDLPAVTTIGGGFPTDFVGITGAPDVTLTMGQLTYAGAIEVGPQLAVSVPHLTTAGNIVVQQGGSLALPALTGAAGLVVEGPFTAPELATLSGGLTVTYSPPSGLVAFSTLTSIGAGLWVENDVTATQLSFPVLANVGAGNAGPIQFNSDTILPECRAQAFVQLMQSRGWTGTPLYAWLASGPCP